jgi:hypothetical protein
MAHPIVPEGGPMGPYQSSVEDLIDVSDPAAVLGEIKHVVSLAAPSADIARVETVHADTIRLFNGDYPGYRASNTKYHNLEHTHAVVLASVRLMHGCILNGISIPPQDLVIGTIAAYFHDVGLIQTDGDTRGTGAKYTVGHEERSIDFMRTYLSARHLGQKAIEDGAQIIRCTILARPLAELSFRTDAVKTLGQIVGTADLLAQMADRQYLEKLLLLYEEFQEAGLEGYASELELLKKTKGFYESVVLRRFTEDLGNVTEHMKEHFKRRWGIDKNPYAHAIATNLRYLAGITKNCKENPGCYFQTLRRGGIAREKNPAGR